ncbi:MAG: hypothetical protein ACLP9L_19005 [Thermoguttaceae bacterium]
MVMVQSVGLIRPAANPVAVKIGVANFPETHNLVLRYWFEHVFAPGRGRSGDFRVTSGYFGSLYW